MSHPKVTWHELLDESGKLWATVRGTALSVGGVLEVSAGLAFTTGRKPQPKRTPESRLVPKLSGWVRDRGEDRIEWELPGRDARIEATDDEGNIRATLVCERERISIRDAAGNPRVVLSINEEPLATGERFRIALEYNDEVSGHFVLIDGAAPVGKTAEYLMP